MGVVPLLGLTDAHGMSAAVQPPLPSMMKGKPCCVPLPVSLAAAQAPVNCSALPVVACPLMVMGGAHGPELRLPSVCQSSQ